MKKLCLALLLLLSAFLAADHENIRLTAEAEPLVTWGNCVNLLTGDFFEAEQDLSSIEPLELELTRLYDSGHLFESKFGFGVGLGYPLHLDYCPQMESGNLLVEQRHGCKIPFKAKVKAKKGFTSIEIDPSIYKQGYTNCGGRLSETRVSCSGLRKSPWPWQVLLPDGTVRTYSWFHTDKVYNPFKKKFIDSRFLNVLKQEIRPNGLQYFYEYQGEEALPKRIRVCNRDGSLELARFDFTLDKKSWHVRSSLGPSADYELAWIDRTNTKGWDTHTKRGYYLKRASFSHKPETSYEVSVTSFTNLVKAARIKKPEGRLLKIAYTRKQGGRVKSLSNALGKQVSFHYGKRKTSALDALGKKSLYSFSQKRLVKKVEQLPSGEALRRFEFEWGRKGRLLGKKLFGKGAPPLSIRYLYDGRGNILCKKLIGNLTGEGKEEERSFFYSYEEGFRNRVLEEELPNGSRVSYGYLGATNLQTSKRLFEGELCREREFTRYDINSLPIEILRDDGEGKEAGDLTGATYRTIREILPELDPKEPGFLQPKEIRDSFLDLETGERVLLKRKEFSYHPCRKVACKRVFGSDGSSFSTFYDYNSRLQLTRKENALGEVSLYTYDENGNLLSEEREGSGKKTLYTYDRADRLRREIECHEEGLTLETSHSYDLLGNRLSTTDPYGNKTLYRYDPFSRLVEEVDPFGFSKSFRYDGMDNLIEEIDEEGNSTKKSYTSLGALASIEYPDGSFERFTYDLAGRLILKEERTGALVRTSYDYRDRPLLIEKLDSEGNLLSVEEKRYKGDLLLFERDPNGVETLYSYDGAGRLIEKKRADLIESLSYDAFSRPYRRVRGEKVNIKLFDPLGRVVESRVETGSGELLKKVEKVYDLHGNVTKTRENGKEKTTLYNSQNLPILSLDGEGHATEIEYLHERGFEKITRDPLGKTTLELFDAKKRPLLIETSKEGELLSKLELAYSPKGELARKSELLAPQTVEWSYDFEGNLLEEIEQGEKRTLFAYERGLLVETLKPSGLRFLRSYDPLGRLKRLRSSDGSVDYSYSYDPAGNLIEVEDSIHKRTTKRTYDAHQRLVRETLENGLTLSFAYDLHGRPLKMTLPDGSRIRYERNPKHLLAVERKGKRAEFSYDLSGNLIEARSFAGETVSYSYDNNERLISIESPSFKQKIAYDPAGNILSIETDGESSHFAYDPLYRLAEEKGSFEGSFRFDALGCCLEQNGLSQLQSSLHRLLNDGVHAYSYDADGNCTSNGRLEFSYDALGRLVKAGSITYSYDSFDRLMSRTEGEEEELFFYFDALELGSEKALRILAKGIRAIEKEGCLYPALCNYRGDLVLIQDLRGNKLASYAYSAFGTSRQEGSFFSPWQHSGKRFDPATSLLHFPKRVYDPATCRWMTPDPIGFEDGLNLYAYVHNNPLSISDPYGLWGESFMSSWDEFKGNACEFGGAFTRGAIDDTTWGISSLALGDYQCNSWNSTAGYYMGVGSSMIAGIILTPHMKVAQLGSKIATSHAVRKITSSCIKKLGSSTFGKETFKLTEKFGISRIKGAFTHAKCYDLNEFSAAGHALDRGGLTRAGRALDKHGGRAGSVFPKAAGNPASKNLQGQLHLDDILTDPRSRFSVDLERKGFLVFAPDGRGAFFRKDKVFRGFMEKSCEKRFYNHSLQ